MSESLRFSELSRRRKAAVALGAVYLVFVSLGVAKVYLPTDQLWGRAVEFARILSASHYTYGFFAPEVGTQFHAELEYTLPDGSKAQQPLDSSGPSEASLRRGGVVSTFWYAVTDPALRRSISASWAAHGFSQRPEAETVTVRVHALKMRSMKEYRSGKRNEWRQVYEASFFRDGGASG